MFQWPKSFHNKDLGHPPGFFHLFRGFEKSPARKIKELMYSAGRKNGMTV
jgi:hypothetical protein